LLFSGYIKFLTKVTSMQYSTKTVDHLGLVAGMVDELGIVEVIDKAISQDLKKRHVTIGQVVKAMILNGLGFTGRPIYLTPQFFTTKALDILIGKDIQPSHLNDNTIGRALDALYSYGASTLFALVSTQAYKALDLKSRYLHLDSTSFKVYGNDYAPSEKYDSSDEEEVRPSVIEVTRGYSKDHRPDLYQVMLNMIVENSAGIPVAIEAIDGNSSDRKTFVENVKRFSSLIKTHTEDSCVIADSAIYSKENLQTLKKSGICWITRVPETIKEAKESIASTYDLENWSMYDDKGKYRYTTSKNNYADIEQLWIVVHSKDANERAKKTLARQYEKLSLKEQKAITTLSKERFACEADAQKALERLQKRLKLTQIEAKIESIPRYSKKGRPDKNKEVDFYEYYVVCSVCASSLQRYQEELHDKSCFILATNDMQKAPEEIIKAYKNQYVVERGFAFLKSKEFFVDALYLKSPERIEALLMVMTLSLLVYTALEHRIRKELKRSDQPFVDQKGKPTRRPTARWIFQCFEGIQLLSIGDSDQRTILNLNDRHRLIVSLLGRFYEKIYFLGNGV